MKEKRIKAIIEKKVSTLAALAGDLSATFDKETIHEFRVTIKSLRAFLRLLQMHTGNEKIRISRKTKELYDILGAIREAQLELEVFEKTQETIPSYIQYLQHTIELKKCEWGKYATNKVFSKLLDKLTGIKYRSLSADALSDFLANQWEAGHTILANKKATGDQLHTARKRVKDILHIEKLAAKHWKSKHAYALPCPLKTLDTLADAIGKYNDSRIQRAHLNAFVTRMPDSEEKTTIKTLAAKETARLSSLRPGLRKTAQACIKEML